MRVLQVVRRFSPILGSAGQLRSGHLKIGRIPVQVQGWALENYLKRNGSVYRPGPNWKDPHMDELPLPDGSWDTDFKKKNSKYNNHLMLGVSFFLFTICVIFTSGLVQFNATIPKLDDEMMLTHPACPPPKDMAPKC